MFRELDLKQASNRTRSPERRQVRTEHRHNAGQGHLPLPVIVIVIVIVMTQEEVVSSKAKLMSGITE